MKISIVTATYNSGKTVRDTFKSVLMQNYDNYELIVVDGGSKDDTVEIIRLYELIFDGRMKWISEPDRGIYDAMNKGIAMATGDVVGFLNSETSYLRFLRNYGIEHRDTEIQRAFLKFCDSVTLCFIKKGL